MSHPDTLVTCIKSTRLYLATNVFLPVQVRGLLQGGFNQHYQASAKFPLTSAVDESQQHQVHL